ncbi:uncharacterized protein LOC115231516 [Octopus sinensis]|uniref:Uncharacterized protein LOC115231516 n=1 Tax=Octopus sinensis TaxID=2607531 RepID=A0A6P7U025_9MOLL|nr:uncharacterized protein LOC115231516 [Octopus sinensis]
MKSLGNINAELSPGGAWAETMKGILLAADEAIGLRSQRIHHSSQPTYHHREVSTAIAKLKNGRSSGPDGINSELFKYGPPALTDKLAELLNGMFMKKEFLGLDSGLLIPIQKPNKQAGPVENLRPIILLNTLRKLLGLVTLNRIREQVDNYLSPSHSGFRTGRSTADAVWAHKWYCAITQRYKSATTVLGIDLSRAFDTVRRGLLLKILEQFLDPDSII